MIAVTRALPHALAGSLCAGLAAANVVRGGSLLVLALAGALAVCAAASGGERRLVYVGIALALGGWWWGSARLDALDRSILAARVGEAAASSVVVTGPARRSRFELRVPAEVRRFGRIGVRERVLLELPLGRSPPQGAVIDLVATIRRPEPPEGDFDERGWLHRQGIHVVLRAERWRLAGYRGGLRGVADRLRARLAESLAPGIRGERRAVLAGIVLGEDEGLSSELRESFRASGLYHLLAVSGQNVALLAGGVLALAWLLAVPRLVAEGVILVAIAAYVVAVGWQPSVVRAGIAGALASLAWLASRQRDRWYCLLLGAAVLLAWNPYSLLEPGFQLSFLAVAAIFVAVPHVARALEGYPVPQALAAVVAVSLACGVATAPVVWLHFGAIPLYSIPANVLAAPVVGPLLGLGLVAAVVEPVLPSAAAAIAWVNGWLAEYLIWCARFVASLPYSQLTSARALAVVAAIPAGVAICVRLHPPRGPRALVVAGIGVAVLVAWSPPSSSPPPPSGLRMTFLDVGQGDATLIQVPGAAALVDQGPPEADVAGQLRRLGVERLDLVILTHPSRDNIGGAESVVEEVDVGLLTQPDLPFDNPFGDRGVAAARERGARVVTAEAGQAYLLGKLRLAIVSPTKPASPADDPNDHAVVILASYGSFDALLPADAESNVTGRLALPRVELLKVGHHGSADPELPELLARLRPAIAVISVGKQNEYGHPRPSTLAALRGVHGLRLYRTDRDGRIVVETDGERISAHAGR